MNGRLYKDRRSAGEALAPLLSRYANRHDVLVLGLPRGGIPVAASVAQRLGAPMDVLMVRKIGVPGHRDLAMGAVATGDVVVVDEELLEVLALPRERFEEVLAHERAELARRERVYRQDRPRPRFDGKVLILVDDGLATGSTMRAAVAAVKRAHPSRVVVAVPVAPPATAALLANEADEVVCPCTPEPFYAVGLWYEDFPQVSDDEVRALLMHGMPLQEHPQAP
ncbi:MAG: phosphoribosyltransferase [Myxococcota bacterium]